MGAHPYWYFVNYTSDPDKALQDLRRREFEAGRYNPVTEFIDFPIDANSPTPGAEHESIEAAMEAAAEMGTRSILDIVMIEVEPNYGAAAPLDEEVLQSIYETTEPTREMVENNLNFLETVEPGTCVYFTIYDDGKPEELIFAGWWFD